MIFAIRVRPRLTGVNLSRNPGLDLRSDLLQHYREYDVLPVVFEFLHHIRTSILLASSLINQVVFHMKCNQIQLSYYVEGSFCLGIRQKEVYLLVKEPKSGTEKYTLVFAYDSPRRLVK